MLECVWLRRTHTEGMKALTQRKFIELFPILIETLKYQYIGKNVHKQISIMV